ncbi:MAG: hypothetical protein RMK49_18065 [Abditibacteriales bacterium]|nr:hypothetical protein [Abditibacteriales bacterium]
MTPPVWAQLPATDPAIQNQFLLLRAGTAGNSGDFDIFITSGDPDTLGDDGIYISSSVSTVATLRILTNNAGAPLATPTDVPLLGGSSPVATGTGDTLYLVLAAALDPDGAGFTTLWRTQPPATNPQGGISIKQNLRLLRHLVQITYEIQNNDVVARTLGFALSLHNAPNGRATVPVEVDGWATPGAPLIRTERTYTVSNMPSQIFAVGNVADPTRLTVHLLKGQQATPPDKFLLATSFAALTAATPFAYVTDNRLQVRTAPATSLVWNPVRFAPREKRVYTTYLGLGFASGDFTPPYVLAAQSPAQLSVRVGDDPTTPSVVENNHIDPNPFAVKGFIYNTSQVTFNNISMTITLPPGLELDAGESPVKVIPIARPLQDVSVEWRVRATGTTSGTLTYAITASLGSAIPKTVTRVVNVPSLAQGLSIRQGVQMITFPYNFANPDVAAVFVDEQTGSLGPIQVARWNPIRNTYEFYPADFSIIEPGRAYWVRVEQAFTLKLNSATALPITDPFLLQLRSSGSGWNMIGNPFLHPLFIGAMQVSFNNQLLDFEEAVQRALIRNTLYFFDPTINNYRLDTGPTRRLNPGVGYWIRALRDVTLVIPPATPVNSLQLQRALPTTAAPSGLSAPTGGWQLQISAVTNEGQDPDNFIGVAPDARDDFDPQDIEEPPPLNLPVVVNFPHPDWGNNSGKFARDLRAATGGRKVWEMVVETNLKSPAPVTLNFPNLHELPRPLRVSLVNLSTNQTVSLRARRSLTFQAPAGSAVHPFRLIVEERRGGALNISSVNFSRARGSAGVVTFSVNKPAKVQCVLLSPTGKTVRVLAKDFNASPGLNTIAFDGKNQQGTTLGRGIYLLRFTATSTDDETTGAIKVVHLK